MPFVPSVNIGGGVRRSAFFHKELNALPFDNEKDVNTPFHLFKKSSESFKDSNFVGHRPKLEDGNFGDYVWKSYGDTFKDVSNFALGLSSVCGLTSGATGETQKRIGIYTVNRPEALESLMAIWSRRGVAVPLYDSLIPNAVTYLVDHAELETVLVERSKLSNIIQGKGTKGTLKHLVLFEDATEEERAAARAAGLQLISLSELKKAGEAAAAAAQLEAVSPTPDDWAYVMYTSGTTGDPKGVILTQRNVLASATGVLRNTKDGSFMIYATDVYVSYLPMAHSFEVCMQIGVMGAGAAIGYYSGDVAKLVTHDMPALKPTFMAGVPRVYNRIFHRVQQSIEAKGGVAQTLFNTAFSNQSWCLSMGFRNPLWDLVIFGTIQKALGGRVRLMASGAAPLSADLQTFMRVVFGAQVLQGYGMTENAAAATAQGHGYVAYGNIGGPTGCTEVKLVDTDDYKTTDVYPATADEFEKQVSFKGEFDPAMAGKVVERGEICLRGHNVFQGYFKMEKETKETLTADGWLQTGDIGQWEPDGALRIVDRKKNIFKLSQGEYVSPESVEVAACSSKWIMQIWVYGSSFETCVVAVVVPDVEELKMYIKEHSLQGSLAEVCETPQVKDMIYKDLVATLRHSKMRSFEIPKDIAFITEVNNLGQGFTIEQDTLTPTFKLRRLELYKKYRPIVEKLYAEVKVKEQAADKKAAAV